MATVHRKALNKAVRTVAQVIGRRPANPIVANVLLEASELTEQLRITATDLTVRVSVSIPCQGNLCAAVSPRDLISALKASAPKGAEDMVHLSTEPTVLRITREGSSGSCAIPATVASLFPLEWTLGDIRSSWVFDAEQLGGDALAWVANATSTDETRQHIVRVLASGAGMLVATDGHRMHCSPNPFADVGDMLLPKAGVRLLAQLAQQGQRITVERDSAVAIFRSRDDAWELCMRLASETFPPWQMVLPRADNRPVRFRVAADVLHDAVRSVAIGGRANKGIRWTINGAMQLSGGSPDGHEATSSVELSNNTHKGEDLLIGFNHEYLTDALAGSHRDAWCALGGDLDPLRIDLDGGRVAVVMPMRL